MNQQPAPELGPRAPGAAASTSSDEPGSNRSASATNASGNGTLGLGPVGDLIGGDWPIQAADTIERVITGVRRKTTGPVIIASRAVVYGIVAAVFGLAAFVLFIIIAVRLVDLVLPTWAVYLIIGAIFSLGGIIALRRAHRPADDA